MSTIIDGYNLLHATGIIGRGIGPGSLERARGALLNFLASAVDPAQLKETVVVFDAKDAPTGLPRQVNHRGITVHYAAQYEDADSLIEELIRAHATPRRLTVVSSDHRLHKAARRRRANAIDSDQWYDELVRQRRLRSQSVEPTETKPSAPLTTEEVQNWLDEFGEVDFNISESPTGESPTVQNDERNDSMADVYNPFPPGYADDLLEES